MDAMSISHPTSTPLTWHHSRNWCQESILLTMNCLPPHCLVHSRPMFGYQMGVSTTKCLLKPAYGKAHPLLLSPGSKCLRMPLLAKRVCSATGSGIAGSRQT